MSLRRYTDGFTLFAPEAPARVHSAEWSGAGARLFDVELVVGAVDQQDHLLRCVCNVRGVKDQGILQSVEVLSAPIGRCSELHSAALHAVERMGGAGMDVLLARAKTVWQVGVASASMEERRGILQVVVVLSHVLSAPVLPPEGDRLFGVRGSRIRLEETETLLKRQHGGT